MNTTPVFPNASRANERAQYSNSLANKARQHRDQYFSLKTELDNWTRIMVDTPVLFWSIVNLFLAVAEIIVSWSMYEEVQSNLFNLQPVTGVTIFFGLVIVILAAVVSHLFSKSLSTPIFELEVFNFLHKNDYNKPRVEAEEIISVKRRSDLWFGVFWLFVLLTLVTLISFNRVLLMGMLNDTEYSIWQNLIPIIIVIFEVFCGIYLFYLFNRIKKTIKMKVARRKYDNLKNNCAYEAKMANESYQHAIKREEEITHTKDLKDCIFRYEKRSHDNDNYVDEIPESKSINVLITEQERPKSGVHLYGILPNRKFTNGINTNENGQANLEWIGDDDYLVGLMVNNIPIQGPYPNNSNFKISIDQIQEPKAKREWLD